MTTVLLTTAVLLVGCALVGGAVLALAGLDGPRGCAPAVGLAALMTVVAPLARLDATVAAVALVALPVAALAAGPARRIGLGALADGAWVAVAMLVLLALPWLAAGHDGVLGMGMNNDTALHLAAARWLVDRAIPETDTLVGVGYPIGPHALTAALERFGVALEHGFSAVSLMAPLLVALAARDRVRGILAIVVGLSYLLVAYYVQMAFKEALEAALVLPFVLVLGRVRSPRATLPLAVLAAGMVHVLSWPGLIWPAAVLAVWAVVEAVARRRSPLTLIGRLRTTAVAGAGALLVLIALELPRIADFQGSRYAHEPDHGLGNLEGTLPPYKAIGIWLDPDFRFGTRAPVLVALLVVAAVGLAAVGVARWWRGGDRLLPSALLAAWLVWVLLDLTKNGYNAAKALPIAGALFTLAIATGATAAWRSGRGATARRAVVIAVVAAAMVSSLWALREAVVGVDAHHRELQALAAVAPPGPLLLLDNADWAAWDLYGVQLWQPPLLYTTRAVPIRPEKVPPDGHPFDLDSVDPAVLNRIASIVTARNAAGSAPLPGLRVLRRTRSFTLWQRTGTIPPDHVLREGWRPGAVLDCATPAGKRLKASGGWALVRPAPVVAGARGWHGSARSRGTTAFRTLRLPPGRWDVALQYVSRNPLTVTAGDVRTTLPGNLDRLGPFFSLGTTAGGTLTMRVRVDAPGRLPGWLGATNSTRALSSFAHQPLGAVIATRHGQAPRRIPLARACGRYVDRYGTS